jgi:hypothetical protein
MIELCSAATAWDAAEIVQRYLDIPAETWAGMWLPDNGRPLGPKGNGHAKRAD